MTRHVFFKEKSDLCTVCEHLYYVDGALEKVIVFFFLNLTDGFSEIELCKSDIDNLGMNVFDFVRVVHAEIVKKISDAVGVDMSRIEINDIRGDNYKTYDDAHPFDMSSLFKNF